MNLKKWIGIFTAVVLLSYTAIPDVAFAIRLDEGLLNTALKELNELNPALKKDAIDLLKVFFQDEEGLEDLKDILPDLIETYGEKTGKDYESLLSNYGLTLGKIKNDIDELKNWSRSDRIRLLDLIEKGDKSGIKALIDKYEKNSSGQTAGNAKEQSEETQPALPSVQVKFTDIENHWAKPYIEFLSNNGIIKGKTESVFAPEDKVTRAEFAAMLVRLLKLEEESSASAESPFSDVKQTDWYYPPVIIAYNYGLVKGDGDKFYPNNLISRQEMAALATRAASFVNKSTFVETREIDDILSPYKDHQRVSDWAKTEVAVAVKLGLIRGMGEGIIAPLETATRAQAATVMYNLYKIIYDE